MLDNLEHLAVAQDASRRGVAQRLIAGLLHSAPFWRMLATSRVRLQVTGERLYRLHLGVVANAWPTEEPAKRH